MYRFPGQFCTRYSATRRKMGNAPPSKKDGAGVATTNNIKRDSNITRQLRDSIRGIFEPKEPQRLPPKRHPPKQLLFGCTTVDEHYDYIEEVIAKVSNLRGKEGLEVLGFEYRLVHHPETCTCDRNSRSDDDDLTSSNSENGYDEDKEDDDDLDYGEDATEAMDQSNATNGVQFTNSDLIKEEEADEYGQFDSEEDASTTPEGQSFMVPVGTPLKKQVEQKTVVAGPSKEVTPLASGPELASPSTFSSTVSSGEDQNHVHVQTQYPSTNHNNNGNNNYSPYNSKSVSRSTSAVSLFSLATHNTDFSRQTHRNNNNNKNNRFPLASISSQNNNNSLFEEESCALRLHHVRSGEMVTPENHLKYMADGKMYDELSRLCMEYAQQVMLEEGNLKWKTLSGCNNDNNRDDDANDADSASEQEEPVREGGDNRRFGAMVSQSYLNRLETGDATGGKKRDTLLIITGKGEVRAGIFSRRHLLVTSMEAATALPFIREGQKRDMDIVMLDPNALGYRLGMDVVETSLNKLFLESKAVQDENIYVLAHSMAGAQIVRFLTNNSSSYSRTPTGKIANADEPSKAYSRESFLKRIQAIAFTDSNHNINWCKQFPALTELLTGPPSLYIKSHKVHEKAKELGETHHDCHFWKHRFGSIKTLWAGTHEHALTNYTALEHIWDHFDTFLKSGNNDRGG